MLAFKIIFAFLYDLLLLTAVWFFAAIPFVIWQGGNFSSQPFTLLSFQLYLLAITYFYLSYFWIQTGQTPGLRSWKLQLVRKDGFLLTRQDANLRFITATLLFWIGWITLFTSKRQTLQDHLAQTKIIAVSD